jgi:hypothetical protein
MSSIFISYRHQIRNTLSMPNWEYNSCCQQFFQLCFDLGFQTLVHFAYFLLEWFGLRLHRNNMLDDFCIICL